MLNMVNMTTRRTDRDVFSLINEAITRDEVISISQIAECLDCHTLTVIRSLNRLETLRRLEVDRSRKPNRYRIPNEV